MTTAGLEAASRSPRVTCLVVALCGLLAPGCQSKDFPPTIEREDYVEAYVELLKAAAAAPDSAAASDSARAVLRRRGLTEADLADFAMEHARDPGYMAGVWGEIENRLRERPPPPEESETEGTPE